MSVTTAALAVALGTAVAPAAGSMRTAVAPVAATSIHGQASNVNACVTTIDPPLVPPSASSLTVRISSDASPAPHLGGPITLSKTRVRVTTPSDFLLQAYEADILSNGQAIPMTLALEVGASNTVEGSHQYATIHASPTVTIHDPDGVPHSGDETADPLVMTGLLPHTVWHPADPSLRVRFTEAAAVVTLTVSVGGTPFVSTQTCSVAKPRPFVVVLPT